MRWGGPDDDLIPLGAGADRVPERRPDLETSADQHQRPTLLETAVCALFVVAAISVAVWTSCRAYLYIPYADSHDWIAQVFATESTRDWLGYLWAPHTEQRIPIARAVEALDVEFARGRAPSFLIATWAALALGLISVAALIWRSRVPLRLKLWTTGLTGLLLLNVAVAEDLAFPVFSVYLFVAGPALAALACFQFAPKDSPRSGAFVSTLAFAVLAGFGNAAGLAIWPALLASAWLQARSATQVRILLIAATACFIFVEAGLGLPSRSIGTGAPSALPHLLKMVSYFTVYGGLPWTRAIHPAPLAQLFGLAIETAAIAAAIRSRGDGEDGYARLQRAGAAMIIFGLFTAVLATIGRVDESAEAIVPTRYAPFSSLIQAGLVLCCTRPLARLLRSRPKQSMALLSVLGVMLLAPQIHGARFLARTADRIRAASASFDAGRRSDGGVVLYPDLSKAAAVRAQLRARQLPY